MKGTERLLWFSLAIFLFGAGNFVGYQHGHKFGRTEAQIEADVEMIQYQTELLEKLRVMKGK